MRARPIIAGLLLCLSSPARADDADIAQAKALDQEGVRAYQDGRYHDAIDYFSAALARGGPPVELWNIARCHLKVDEPEGAREALDRYLEKTGLSPEDRAEAMRTRAAIAQRPSPLTLTSTPAGARVSVDGTASGATPVTLSVAPGEHEVLFEHGSHSPITTRATATPGRARIVHADLPNPLGAARRAPFSLELGLGVAIPGYGDVAGRAGPAGLLRAVYTVASTDAVSFGLGARLGVSAEGWGTSSQVASLPIVDTCKPQGDYSGATLAGHALASAGLRISTRLSGSIDAGFGVAGIATGPLGGDVFMPVCGANTGLQPAGHLALAASYEFATGVHFVLRPLVVDAQSAFSGARSAPVDASGIWLRVTFTAGIAKDF